MFCAVLPPGQLLLTMCTMVSALLLVQPYVFCAVLPPGQLLLTMCTMVNALLLVQPYVLCSSPSWSTSVDNVYHGECLALSSAICFVQFSLLVNFC